MPRKERKPVKPKIEVKRMVLKKYASEEDFKNNKPFDVIEKNLSKEAK